MFNPNVTAFFIKISVFVYFLALISSFIKIIKLFGITFNFFKKLQILTPLTVTVLKITYFISVILLIITFYNLNIYITSAPVIKNT